MGDSLAFNCGDLRGELARHFTLRVSASRRDTKPSRNHTKTQQGARPSDNRHGTSCARFFLLLGGDSFGLTVCVITHRICRRASQIAAAPNRVAFSCITPEASVRSVVKSRAGESSISPFSHFLILILPQSHIALIRIRLHDPPVRRRQGGRGQGRLRMTPLRPPRSFWYNSVIQPQGSADAERGPGSQEPGS